MTGWSCLEGMHTMGFTECLTLLFIALKLTHQIAWPWWQVLLPEIIGGGLYVVALILAVCGVAIGHKRIRRHF